jgi:hypothetical protein
MELLFAMGSRLRASDTVDPELKAALTNLSRLQLEELLPAGTLAGKQAGKRQSLLIGAVPLDRLELWLDTIRSTLASLLARKPVHQSLIGYSRYLREYDPPSNITWFIPLAIQSLEDQSIKGATSQAAALARLGATEALPALRRALERDYRDQKVLAEASGRMRQWAIQTEENFDAEVKRSLRQALASLEGKVTSGPSAGNPNQFASAVPAQPSAQVRGMSRDDVCRVEATVGRQLPQAVREFFLQYPAALRTTVREIGTAPDGRPCLECPADNELTGDPDALIAYNKRQLGYDADWPDNVLVVGEGACGECYWTDLDDENGAVYLFDAGTEPENSARVANSLGSLPEI